MDSGRMIRVLIVEDSRVNQELLRGLLSEDPEFVVIGIVSNGLEAVRFVEKTPPDVISMDINMPVMSGIEATRTIMHSTPVPIVITSSQFPDEGNLMMSILEAGALTILPLPYGPGHEKYLQTAKNYRYTLKAMARVQVKSLARGRHRTEKPQAVITDPEGTQPRTGNDSRPVLPGRSSGYQVISIGASAGGPQVILFLLNNLPVSIPVPLLIVQHLDATFAEGFYSWLGSASRIPVHVAKQGEKMLPGHAYLPPGDHHLGVLSPGFMTVNQKPPEKGLRPAVSVLFRDVLTHYGKHSINIILSGMGSDGAQEMKMLFDAGAYTIAQDAESSIVHGMPGEAIKLGGATRVLSPADIVKDVRRLLHE